ncbi:MAG: methylenetetrahydrofolate reductase [Thermodesulfobacteriota bacterium]|nr:methylenetetrahydrofolate reductase [Thermodesulfobacteriota bacterium]
MISASYGEDKKITQSPNHSITQSLNHQITKFSPGSLHSKLHKAMEERLAQRDSGYDVKGTKRNFVVTFELVPARASKGKAIDEILQFAKEAAVGGLISALSITDNAGGHPALTPRALGSEIMALGIDPIIHFSCKDKNRNLVESQLFVLDRSGLKNLLVLTGDYPRYGFMGNAKPVFDLDSVQVLDMISHMNQGFVLDSKAPFGGVKLAPMNFNAGCVVSPFKRQESELIPQYLKLKRKVAAGASFVITQMGWDVRKFDELRRFMDREGLVVPLIGTVFIPTTGLARTLCRGEIPGCILPDRLLERIEQDSMSDDKEGGPRLERAARLVSILKGIGYEGVHLSGPGLKYAHVEWIIERAKDISERWQLFTCQFLFPEEWKFWYFKEDPETWLNYDEPTPGSEVSLSLRDSLGLSIGRLFHKLAFEPEKSLFNSLRKMAGWIDDSSSKRHFTSFEYQLKEWLYDCRRCGDCTLEEMGFLWVNRNWCGKSSPFCQLFVVLQVVMPILTIDIFLPFIPLLTC